MSTETESASAEQATSEQPPAAATSPGTSEGPSPQEAQDARYASQAAAARPAPIAFEGGASAPGSDGGTTGRGEWTFLTLTVLFSLALVAIPAVFFTSIDLTDAPDSEQDAPAGNEGAREIERLQLLQETRADALAKLYTYGPAEDDSTAFRIPLERAMRLTQSEVYATTAPASGERSGEPIIVPADSAAAAR